MSKNIGYHTRLYGDNTVKVCGGSFGGEVSMETANRMVKAHFTVEVLPSGSAVFVDKQGRHVRLYFSIDAEETEAGIAALKAWRTAKYEREQREAEDAEARAEEIESLMAGLTHEEIVARLKRGES